MTDIDAAELARLREIAQKATPGPWSTDRPTKDVSGFLCGVAIAAVMGGAKIYGDPPGGQFPGNDQRHIAAFDPRTVLSLIDALEKARAINDCHCVNVEATTSERDLAESALAAALPFLAPQPSQSDEELARAAICDCGDVKVGEFCEPNCYCERHFKACVPLLAAVRAEATLAGAASETAQIAALREALEFIAAEENAVVPTKRTAVGHLQSVARAALEMSGGVL